MAAEACQKAGHLQPTIRVASLLPKYYRVLDGWSHRRQGLARQATRHECGDSFSRQLRSIAGLTLAIPNTAVEYENLPHRPKGLRPCLRANPMPSIDPKGCEWEILPSLRLCR